MTTIGATLSTQMQQELRQNILPFWLNKTRDLDHGGFFGALTNDCQIHNEVERSLVLCARVL
jgi:mannobiose 2-epimerase